MPHSSAHKNKQTNAMLRGSYLGQVGAIVWAKIGGTKNGQLGPDNNPSNVFVQLFSNKGAETPIYCVLVTQIRQSAQIITLKLANLGPDNNSLYIYIYIYIFIYICIYIYLYIYVYPYGALHQKMHFGICTINTV